MLFILKKYIPIVKCAILHRQPKLEMKRCQFYFSQFTQTDDWREDERELTNPDYTEISNDYIGLLAKGHRVFVIQPRMRFQKENPLNNSNTTPELQLAEACALVNTLPYWTVVDQMILNLSSLRKSTIFGPGQLDNIKKKIIAAGNVSAVFISLDNLLHVQKMELERILDVAIFDRYSIVIHIFRCHAKSIEAKLQVALAELPYIYRQMSELNGRINLLEQRRLYLHSREAKIKTSIQKLKLQRSVRRQSRKSRGLPTVAIVGYTNCGKTTLIRALTGDENLQPRNVLFATLDTTAHLGYLPCTMKVLFIDTIGFIQNVPEVLIEPFVATLEDALIADLIIHIYDASHPDKVAQIAHVRKTLETLTGGTRPIIEVANKCDLIKPGLVPEETLGISASRAIGIDLLRNQIEEILLNQEERAVKRMKVAAGSLALQWLFKETTVLHCDADPKNPQYMLIDVVITDDQMHKFRRFIRDNPC